MISSVDVPVERLPFYLWLAVHKTPTTMAKHASEQFPRAVRRNYTSQIISYIEAGNEYVTDSWRKQAWSMIRETLGWDPAKGASYSFRAEEYQEVRRFVEAIVYARISPAVRQFFIPSFLEQIASNPDCWQWQCLVLLEKVFVLKEKAVEQRMILTECYLDVLMDLQNALFSDNAAFQDAWSTEERAFCSKPFIQLS